MPHLHLKKHCRNEKGALTFEFLGILPFYFLFFLLLWQVIGSGYAVFTAKSAINDAAKSYASTHSNQEAIDAAKESVGNGNVLKYHDLAISDEGNGKFTMTLEVDHFLTFVPEQWKSKTPIRLNMKATGKVLVQ